MILSGGGTLEEGFDESLSVSLKEKRVHHYPFPQTDRIRDVVNGLDNHFC